MEFIEFLKACITPVALISGVGLLLLTITNRLARTTDRTRALLADLHGDSVKFRDVKVQEIKILYKRSGILRNSIAAMVISVISSSLIIPTLFFMILMEIDLKIVGYAFFVISIFSILVSLVYFFNDIRLTLHALKLEAKEFL